MKKILLLITISVSLFISCDIIEKPFIEIEENLTPIEFPELNPDTVFRKILLEEYTGHRCTNCPNAHDRVAQLLEAYGDTLIPIGIHAGSLAATNAEYPYDFTNPISIQLYNDFSIPFVPIAIVNRIKFSQNSWGSPLASWQNHINMVDRTKKYAAIQLINEFNVQQRELTAHAKVTILDQITDRVQLCLVIIENDIVKPQLRDGIRIPEYNHKHVLRGSLNGNYGAQLTLDGIVEKDSAYQKAYKISYVNKDWNEDHCYVVAYLINMETKEVLQVEHLKVK